MKYQLLGMLLLLSFSCYADTIYKQIDNKGNITYTDTPQKNAETVIIPSTPTPATSSSSSISSAAPAASAKSPDTLNTDTSSATSAPYTSFALTSPIDQQTFQNQRIIPIQVKMEPALQSGDKTQLYLDGKPYGVPTEGTELTLNEVDRGAHTVSAVILNKNNIILRSTNTVTINVQYARLGSAVP